MSHNSALESLIKSHTSLHGFDMTRDPEKRRVSLDSSVTLF